MNNDMMNIVIAGFVMALSLIAGLVFIMDGAKRPVAKEFVAVCPQFGKDENFTVSELVDLSDGFKQYVIKNGGKLDNSNADEFCSRYFAMVMDGSKKSAETKREKALANFQ